MKTSSPTEPTTRDHIKIRGIYGGVPTQIFDRGAHLTDYGVNAIFMGSGAVTKENVELLKQEGARVFAEFNTMHVATYLVDHPDAAPVGNDGLVAPPADQWQGVCPTHPGYRSERMEAFHRVLHDFEIDGIWLDYHHSHADWERAVPVLPDTCFCERCIEKFEHDTGAQVGGSTPAQRVLDLLTEKRPEWVEWRCGVFTDWVREFRAIVDQVRPKALLGTYHCPWTDFELNNALTDKLAIDLRAHANYVDVFSIMTYHARFGHHDDLGWISRQTAWLGEYLEISGLPGAAKEIWPIVQLSDWGERVPVEQVSEALEQGTRSPATGIMVFNWGGLQKQPENVEAMAAYYRAIAPV